MRGSLNAFARRLEAFGATFGDTVRSVEASVGSLLSKVNALGAKTDAVEEQLEDAGDQLDRTDAKVDSTEARVERAEKKLTGKLDLVTRLLFGQVGLMTLGFAVLFVLHCQHAPSVAPTTQPPASNVTVNVGVGQGAAETVAKERCAQDPTSCLSVLQSDASDSEQMGKKGPEEKWVPSEPLEGQKRGPCDARYGEDDFGGGCWQLTGIPPPCGRLYRRGDRCYRPISADIKKPVGGESRQVTPERQGQ